jgi:hypothetical protein
MSLTLHLLISVALGDISTLHFLMPHPCHAVSGVRPCCYVSLQVDGRFPLMERIREGSLRTSPLVRVGSLWGRTGVCQTRPCEGRFLMLGRPTQCPHVLHVAFRTTCTTYIDSNGGGRCGASILKELSTDCRLLCKHTSVSRQLPNLFSKVFPHVIHIREST